jgi:hypothetical protein
MAFKLDTLAAAPTAFVQLTHPVTGVELFEDDACTKPVGINVFGAGSVQYRNALNAMHRKATLNKKSKKEQTLDEIRAEGVDLLVACSESAVGLEYKGKPLDKEGFREIYSDPAYSWLREQVDTALGSQELFIKS